MHDASVVHNIEKSIKKWRGEKQWCIIEISFYTCLEILEVKPTDQEHFNYSALIDWYGVYFWNANYGDLIVDTMFIIWNANWWFDWLIPCLFCGMLIMLL